MLAALDALRTAKIAPSVNLKFVFEGEEEAGSPHLDQYLDRFANDLSPDAWILCDGPVHQRRKALLYFGARGVTGDGVDKLLEAAWRQIAAVRDNAA